ncbi:MAG TPA: hypothetical protein PLI72_09465 [Smithellaceae bacterium]|jgi:hypothetical protein|nr:hypothetical protein [Smithellaceae bacterium]
MNDKFNEYEDLIKIIQAVPQATPPADITRRVMGRLPEERFRLLSLFKKVSLGFNLIDKSETSISMAACSFYYFITGLFYLIIGIVSVTYMKKISMDFSTINWIGLQPYFAIGTALWLFSLALVLNISGRSGVNAARYGTILYIFFAVINSLLIRYYLHIPYAIIFVIGLAASSAFMGIMLVQAIRKMDWKEAL